MFCALLRPRYQVSVYRTIGPLVHNAMTFVNMYIFSSPGPKAHR